MMGKRLWDARENPMHTKAIGRVIEEEGVDGIQNGHE